MNKYLLMIISFIFFILSCENGLIGLGEQVDIEAPGITIGNYADGSVISSGDYVHGSIILSGKVSDDIGVSSVGITIVDSLTNATLSNYAEIDYSTMTWSYAVNTTSFSDGEKNITIEVSDTSASPKTDSEERLLYFDNTPPLVLITNPAGYATSDYADSIITIKGETYDQFQVRSVEINMITGSNDNLDTVSGTATWSTVYRSSGTGNYEFVVIATDYAGNVSQGFYHLDDIIAVNDNTYIPVKDIYDVREGITPDSVPVLTSTDLQSPSVLLTSLPFSIDLAGDEPQIAISNPDPTAPANENVLAGNAKAIGSITDDDGINISSIEINIDEGGWGPVDNVTGSGLFVKWDHDLSSLGGGQHTLQIKAQDIFGLPKESSIVNFSINVGAPELEITSPEIGDFLNTGNFTISGTAHDTDNIDEMQISLDDGVSWNAVSNYTNTADVNWTHDVTGQADGNVLIKVRATDDGSFWSYSNLQVNIDTEDPENSFIYPSHNSFVNGLVEIRGASSDNNQLDTVRIRIGDVDPWITIPAEDRYNWTYDFNSLDYENSSDATETSSGSGVWALNIYAELTDVAGNTFVTTSGDYVLKIDNSLDRPTVNVISPYDGQSIGGATLVTGTSFDDDGAVYGVYMQIDVNTTSSGTPNFSDTVSLASSIDFDGTGSNPAVSIIDESAWYLLDGKNPWSVELNSNGELYSTEGGHTGDLYIRIKAIDKDGGVNSISGEYEELHIKMDDSVPYIENLLPVSDEYVSGSFNITGDINDDSQIKNLEVSYNGGAQYHDIIRNGIIDGAYGGGSVTSSYTMNVPVDTSNIPDVGAVTSDSLSIRVKVTDDTNYQTLETLRYYVDNTLPTGTSSDFNSISGSYVNAIISGTATDIGTVNGISHVEAYIVRDISGTKYFYNPQLNDTKIEATTMSINSVVHEYPTTGYEAYLITIDSTAETLGGSNSDGDGIAEELNVGINYDWKYMFDSNNIPDGSVELHYVVFDKAGNASHYEQAGFIKNNIPEIESITVGTDLNGNGAIEVSEETTFLPAAFSATDFTARNDKLKITINLAAGNVNAPLVYSVTYNGGSELITSVSEAQIDMSNHTTYGDISGNGAGFVCTITDDAGLVATETIKISIDNVDDIDPEAEFGELDADTSVPENGGEKEGHIEERSWSNYHNAVADPDVSGKIIFNGTASDNQRIANIYIWIDTDGDGALEAGEKILIADEDTDGTLKSVGNSDITLENLTETGGHDVSFTYEWDSSTLANIAGDDIQIKLLVVDYNGNTNIEQSYPGVSYNLMTVDVVPYITAVTSRLSPGFLSNPSVINRTSMGEYPVAQNEIIRAYAFNISNVSTSLINNINMTESYGVDSSGDYLDITISGSATSGELKLTTNSVSSINNINNNEAESSGFKYNKEPNGVNNDTLTDDKHIIVWKFTNIANTETARYPVMRISPGGTPSFSYASGETDFRMILDNGTITNFETNYTKYNYTNLGFDSTGNIYGVTLNSDRISNSYGGSTRFGFFYSQAGDKSIGNSDGYSNGTFKRHLEHNWNGSEYNSLRIQYPDMVVTGSGTSADPANIYMVYYDDSNKELKFRYGNVTGQNDGDITGAISQNYNNGTTGSSGSVNGYHIIESLTDDDDPASGGTQSIINPGQYSSIDVTSGGVAVVAWYDITSRRLVYSYNTDPSGSTESQWNENYLVIDDSFAGQYVDISVDGNDAIHIAYFNSSSGDLKYAYLDSYNDGTADTVTVDSFLSVGQKIMIDTRLENSEYVPYISYYSTAYAGTQHSLRLASKPYGISLDNGSEADKYTQNWQIMTIPTNNIPKDYTVSVGFLAGRVVVGYATDNGLEYAEQY